MKLKLKKPRISSLYIGYLPGHAFKNDYFIQVGSNNGNKKIVQDKIEKFIVKLENDLDKLNKELDKE
jgi:hypothetical protein